MRITEIENSRGKANFAKVALADLVREVGDLYDPIAEDKHVTLQVASAGNATAYCDRDLLFEAVANLVDNAVKFTPAGGHIDLALARGENENIIRVSDTGQGIAENERDVVMRPSTQIRQKPKYARSRLGSEASSRPSSSCTASG